jgi:hypothetical protein
MIVGMRAWPAIVLCAATAGGAAQLQMSPPAPAFEHYGVAQPVELSELLLGSHDRRAVATKGFVSPLDITGHYYELSGGGNVLLIPVSELGASMSQLTGRRVEVVGLVRQLVQNQGTCLLGQQSYPQSYCDNPDLPPTPDLSGDRAGWPRWSITAWSILDITPLEKRRGGPELASLADALASAAPADKPVRVIGRFCGANL